MSKTTPEEAEKLAAKYGIYTEFGTRLGGLAALIDEVRGVDAEPVTTSDAVEMLRAILNEVDASPPSLYTQIDDDLLPDVRRIVAAHSAPSQPAVASAPTQPVELPVVAWMMEWPNHAPSLTTDKSDFPFDQNSLIPLVKLIDAQAAVAAATIAAGRN